MKMTLSSTRSAIGGDFGGKGALMDTPLCYFLARRLNCPVKMVMTDIEDLAGRQSTPSIGRHRANGRKEKRQDLRPRSGGNF